MDNNGVFSLEDVRIKCYEKALRLARLHFG